jgi:steroid delta-isomerase
MDETAVRQAVAAYFAAIRAGDAGGWAATFAEDGVSHDPVGAPPTRGREALVKLFDGLTGAFARVSFHEREVVVMGDRAAVTWTAHGVGHSGRETDFAGIDVFEFTPDGLIQASWGFWDPASVLSRLA